MKARGLPKTNKILPGNVAASRSQSKLFKSILWTGESYFRRTGIFNVNIYHSWATKHPHITRQTNFQDQFSVNLWTDVVDGQLIGLFELPDYLLEYIDLESGWNMIFQMMAHLTTMRETSDII